METEPRLGALICMMRLDVANRWRTIFSARADEPNSAGLALDHPAGQRVAKDERREARERKRLKLDKL
jgi:hypothetical protein